MSITKVSKFVLEDNSVSLLKLDTTGGFEGQILSIGSGGIIEFEDKLVTEDVEDIVAGLLVRGNHTNIAVSYADGSNQLNLSATGAVTSVNGQTGVIVLGTDDVAEGSTNLYYTDARADARAQLKIDALVDTAPGTLDTLNELAAALGDDADFSTTITTSIATKLSTADFNTTFDTQLATKDTDNLSEGSTNLYYTDTRARGAISATGSLSYDNSTGVISFTMPAQTTTAITEGTNLYYTDERVDDRVSSLLVAGTNTNITYDDNANTLTISATSTGGFDLSSNDTDDLTEGTTNLYYTDTRARASISVTDNGGDGSVSYDSSTGVISYTGPSAAEVRTHISGGTGVTVTNGEIAIGQSVATTDDVEFADLVLTGDLTVQGTTTTINTETINLADNILLLNSNETGSPTQSGGLEIERGTALNVQFVWDENLDRWSLGAEDLYTSGTFLGDVTGDVTGTVSSIANHDTDDLAEGTNLYYTQSRVDARVAAGFAIRSTTDLSEGANLYYTDARARSAISVSGDLTYNSSTGVISTQGLASSTTDDLAEGTANLYYTESRTDTRVNILRTDLGVSGDANVHFDNISNIPAVTKDVLTGDGTNSAFTMSVTPGNADAVIVTMNGVTQMPGSDYTVNGTTITFSTTPPSGQVILVRHVGYQIVGSVADNDLSITGGTMTGSILVGTDDAYDLGSSTKQWRTIYGHEVESTYADLAERYEADKKLAVGTVVVFGGDKEVTECLEEIDVSVAGIISGKPALKMNSDAGSDDTHPYIALKGRVPCQVIGPVSKGDLLVTSSTPGFAKSVGKRDMGCAVFAKAIETNLENGRKLVEVVVI